MTKPKIDMAGDMTGQTHIGYRLAMIAWRRWGRRSLGIARDQGCRVQGAASMTAREIEQHIEMRSVAA